VLEPYRSGSFGEVDLGQVSLGRRGGGGIPLNEDVAVPTSVAAVDGVMGTSS